MLGNVFRGDGIEGMYGRGGIDGGRRRSALCRERVAKRRVEIGKNTPLSAVGHGADGGGVHKGAQRGIQEKAAMGASTEEDDVPDVLRYNGLSGVFRKDSDGQGRKDRMDMGP